MDHCVDTHPACLAADASRAPLLQAREQNLPQDLSVYPGEPAPFSRVLCHEATSSVGLRP